MNSTFLSGRYRLSAILFGMFLAVTSSKLAIATPSVSIGCPEGWTEAHPNSSKISLCLPQQMRLPMSIKVTQQPNQVENQRIHVIQSGNNSNIRTHTQVEVKGANNNSVQVIQQQTISR